MIDELEELKQQVRQADYSINNVGIQAGIEKELEKWLEHYNTNTSIESRVRVHGCYGGPGDIPDRFEFEGISYTPPQIYGHVKARDEIGMKLMQSIHEFRTHNLMWIGKEEAKEKVLVAVNTDNLDEIMIICPCGQHDLTGRNVLQQMINADPDCIFLHPGIVDGIMQLYGKLPPLNEMKFFYPTLYATQSKQIKVKYYFNRLYEKALNLFRKA